MSHLYWLHDAHLKLIKHLFVNHHFIIVTQLSL